VTGFFEVISTSAPHIYNSALLLSPRMSTIWKLYQPLSDPLTRVIQGVPNLWDQNVVNKRFPDEVAVAAWSPCTRFIAISVKQSPTVQILDAVTFEQLFTVSPLSKVSSSEELVFSPDGHFLTGQFTPFSLDFHFVSWDIQTGGLISDIQVWGGIGLSTFSISYSRCGTMLGVLQNSPMSCCIYTYHILSGTPISSYWFDHTITRMTWTNSEHPQYAVLGSESITIWEVGPTPSHVSREVDSLSIPDNLPQKDFLLSPSLSRVAFISQQRVLVWDTQHHKVLLDSKEAQGTGNMTFSSDDRFFACGTSGPELYLWKESPDGYLLHQKLVSSTGPTVQIISPDRGSIVAFGGPMVHLWQIANSPTSPSDIQRQTPQDTPGGFILSFSPDKRLMAVTGKLGRRIHVFDLKSGHLPLTIDTVEEVYTMWTLKNTITACCHGGKLITWDILAGNRAPFTKLNTCGSVQTTIPKHLVLPEKKSWISISPDLSNIAIVGGRDSLQLYNVKTGKHLVVDISQQLHHLFELHKAPWWSTLEHTPDGSEIWLNYGDKNLFRWKIVKDRGCNITGLEYLQSTEDPPGGFPWDSFHGYQVMDDGWVLGFSRKRLLWLPPHWRGDKRARRWSGRFLALLHGELPEAIILEIE